MGDLRYNEILGNGSQGKQHPVQSLQHYSEALVAYEKEKEKEDSSQKSFTNKWEKVELQNALGELTGYFIYKQNSVCSNKKDLHISTICNYSLDFLCFSIHLPESASLVDFIKRKKNYPVKVNFSNKRFDLNYDGNAFFDKEFCKFMIVTIPIELPSRYLQKSEEWTCKILFEHETFEFNVTGNLPTSWN